MESLAVKYRPTTFEDVCSQASVIKILKRQLETGKITNCYLFSGSEYVVIGVGAFCASSFFSI